MTPIAQRRSCVMRRCAPSWLAAAGLAIVAIVPSQPAPAHAQQSAFVFRDVGREAGLFPHVAGIAGHAVCWGDINGDGWPDLYVATFGGAPYGSKANQLFLNDKGRFTLDEQTALHIVGRAGGALLADLDNNGSLDLCLSNHAIAGREGTRHYETPNYLFRNQGDGRFVDISEASGIRPQVEPGTHFAGRSVCALDYDGDGLLDLLMGECVFQGGRGRSRLLRNVGNLKFEDVTQRVGLPAEGIVGLGVAAADFNRDGWPDLFLAGRDALRRGRDTGNHLYLNDGQGRFRELPREYGDFTWEYHGAPDDIACGVCVGDVNRDGWPDILIGQHFSHPWLEPVPVRLYLHRGLRDGLPQFEEVTQRVGLVPLTLKAPHVEIQDFDNDGWPDIYVSMVKFAGGRPYPVIFRHQGLRDGLPQFACDALAVNDYPTDEDRQTTNVGAFFDKMQRDGKVIYMAPGPTADFDRDGRLDMFLANWWVEQPSLLLRNETPSGQWLQVAVEGFPNVNRQGIGARVELYAPGRLGEAEALLAVREIAVGYGYASGQEAVAHFGLGELRRCDLRMVLPHGRGQVERRDVAAGQRLVLSP
jgi:hypothetical protein